MHGSTKNATLHNQHGQRIGAKGARTRQRIIDVTLHLLEEHGLRDLSVAEIAREAEVSPSSFYVYFDSVQDVVLAALENATQSTPEMLEILTGDWTRANARAKARQFVELYANEWDKHRTVFRIRNLAAEEGDERFFQVRREAVYPLLKALSAQVEHAMERGRLEKSHHPRAAAGVIIAMLDRISAVSQQPRQPGVTFDRMLDSAGYLLACMLGFTD